MRKIMYLCLIILVVGLFTGCIDVIQVVSIKNGVISTSIRYSLQKAMFELAASFTGEEVDYDEFFDMGDDSFASLAGVSGEVNKFETLYDIGAEITFEGKEKSLSSLLDGKIDFIPIKKNNAYHIEIPMLGESGEVVDEDKLGILSGGKYRLIIAATDDLRNISQANVSIEHAYEKGIFYALSHEDGISVSRTGSIMLIEIPMSILFLDEGKIIVKLT